MKKINANAKLALITWNHWEKKKVTNYLRRH